MNNALADRLEIWGFEQDVVIFADGSLGFALECVPVDAACWETNRLNSYCDRIGLFLNALPEDTSLQFVQDVGRGAQTRLDAFKKLGAECANIAGESLARERVQKFEELIEQDALPEHRFLIFVRRPGSVSKRQTNGILKSESRFQAISEEVLANDVKDVLELRETFRQGLHRLDLETANLSVESISELLYAQWNPTRIIPRGPYDPEDVRSSLLFSDASLSESGFTLGDMHHRIVSLKLLPDQATAGMMQAVRELPFDSRLHFTVHIPNQQRELENLQMQRRVAFSMVAGKHSGVSDLDSGAKLQDLEALLAEMIAKGERVYHISLNVVLRSRRVDHLESMVGQTLLKLRELGGAEGLVESLATFDIFAELALPNARATERRKTVKTSYLANLLPVFGPWRGHAVPSLLLRSRSGSLISFDPFSQVLTNYNQVVVGGSGSGKSFLTNLLLLQVLKENPKIFIVDIGGSYKRLCENLHGQNVSIGADPNLALNPFDLVSGENTPSPWKIKFLVGLVEMMTKEEGSTGLPKLERAELEESIQWVYEHISLPCLSNLRERLLSHSSVEMIRLGRILGAWCGKTPFGQIVDRPTTIRLDRPIVAFDLKGIDAQPDLQAVILYIITDFVWREVQKDRSSRKLVVFDECWKLLSTQAGSQFIGEVFRTFRKYFASAIAISQSIDDFSQSAAASAVLSNSSTRWILKQKGADPAKLQGIFQLNETEMALIASLSQERGVFSEVFLMAEDQRTVAVVEPTSLEYWIATTDPREIAVIEQAQSNSVGANTLTVLRELAERHPNGLKPTNS